MHDGRKVRSFMELTGKAVRLKIVDIGANPIDGTPPYARLLAEGAAQVVGFEPNPKALAVLNEKKGPHETYLPHAIGDGKRHTLRFCQAAGMTSLLEPNRKVLELFHGFPEWGRVTGREEIDTVRLDDIPETEGVELIKIDIQGGELMALSNAGNRLDTTLVIQSEVEFLPMYENQPLFSELELYLRGKGFMFHRFHPQVSRVIRPMMVANNLYAGMSQLFWADAIFVRDITRLDRLDDTQLLHTAALVHELCGSIDLALHLLIEYDRRTGERLGASYMTKLQAR